MKHGHYFVSLSGATDSDVRDTAGGKSGTAPGKTEEIFALPVEKGEDRHPVVTVSRTEYFFPDYHLVRVSVARTEGMDKEQAELKLREQLQELTEDPDHTYVVCREPLSFYFGREFRDYLQQEWIEHLLRYGERPGGYPAWPDLVLLGRNPYLPYVVLRYAARLQSMKWYLTEREYREEEEWLTGELEDEYGLIPEIRLLAETADYGRVRLQGTKPCVVLDFATMKRSTAADWQQAVSGWIFRHRRTRSTGPWYNVRRSVIFHEKRVERPSKSPGIP